MKCPKAQRKKRISKSGKGHPSDYRSTLKGHTWKHDNNKTSCSLCGYVKKIYPKGYISTKVI